MKRKKDAEPVVKSIAEEEQFYAHRFHYHWSNLEADRSGHNIGSPSNPHPKLDRTLRLRRNCQRHRCTLGQQLRRHAHFQLCSDVYETIDYNTFTKNGVLKLTEIELYFISSKVTRSSCHEWAVVYLGVGNGERFKYLRDEFFPGLAVIAFDPLDSFFECLREGIEQNAQRWKDEGSDFEFVLKCFDADSDIAWIQERLRGKKLLLISDIRGIHLSADGTRFDKSYDQDLQWKAIERLRPERSLVKFTTPDGAADTYDYAPGVLLKQIFCYYGTTELRLMIDGVPERTRHYDVRELHEQTDYHHRHLRGMVYKSSRHSDGVRCACLDSCFDCTVLWNTASTYAAQNALKSSDVLANILKNHLYEITTYSNRWSDFWFYLNCGRLMEAMATLDTSSGDGADIDWSSLVDNVSEQQPALAQHLTTALPRAKSPADLVRIVGSLSKPFTILRTELNGLLEYPTWSWVTPKDVARRLNAAAIKSRTDVDMSGYKTALCWYWKRGITCFKGDECLYKHGDDDVGAKVIQPINRDICWQFQRGACLRGTECWWKHDIIEHVDATVTQPIAKKICWQFQRGACSFGTECWWKHDLIEPKT